MIDEDVLRQLLAEAAEAAPPPGDTPAGLVDALTATSERSSRIDRRRWLVPSGAIAAALLVAVLVGGALHGTKGSSQTKQSATTALDSAGRGAEGGAAAPPSASADSSATRAATGGGAASSAKIATPNTATPSPATPRDAAKVVKTGSLDLEVRKGTFGRSVDRVTSLVVGLGGYVTESSTAEAEDVPRGAITVRVPASSFEQLVTDLRHLGKVVSVSTKGADVTAQFTDLDARLAALGATRDRLLEVLREAHTVGDIIAVQDRITGVQTEIDQLEGQRRLLADQTAFGTLALTVGEPGATVPGEPGRGLGAAWREARRRFGDGVEGLVEASGTAAVVGLASLVVGVLGWLLWRRARRYLL